jgi:hypothetical protein
MKTDLDNYKIQSKISLGNNLKIIFAARSDGRPNKVLELSEVVGFIDLTTENNAIVTLRIDPPGGSYNLDLSLRLQRPDVREYPEVLIFLDKDCVNLCFRAVAKNIVFRDWKETDLWLK